MFDKHDAIMGITAGTGTLSAGALWVPLIPVNGETLSVQSAHGFCGSATGAIMQGLSPVSASACSSFAMMWFVLWAVLVVSVIAFSASWWASSPYGASSRIHRQQNEPGCNRDDGQWS